jgi:hypothetical protein
MVRSWLSRLGLAAIVLVAAPVFLAGCFGSDRCAVEGTVTLDGQPVDGGIIEFLPLDDAPGQTRGAAHADIKGGKYAVGRDGGPTPGKHKVSIRWLKKTGRMVDVAGDVGNKREETKECIPRKYNTQSQTVVEIKAGTNTFAYDIVSEKSSSNKKS